MNASRSVIVVGETAARALVADSERAIRKALPAPVEGRNRKATRAQVAHGLEIFLDEFGTALQDKHSAFAPWRRRPAGKTQQFTPSGVWIASVTTSSGTGLAGMEMSFMCRKVSRSGGSAL